MADVRIGALCLCLTHAVGGPRVRMKHWSGCRNGFHASSYLAVAVHNAVINKLQAVMDCAYGEGILSL